MTLRRPADQDIIVVGASGDLAARKLLPALYNLEAADLLPGGGRIIGYAVAPWDDAAFLDAARDAVRQHSRTGLDDAVFARFAQRLAFVPASAGVEALRGRLTQPSRIAYLAVPPSAFASLVEDFGKHGLGPGTSIVIEKPFGHDVASAIELNGVLHTVFPEDRIYR
ncbi:MAG TPA: glucose-6-phosphate dehydrogenase, partial [Candidatus Dormibacteraeota bacterium]|nr:glucose-6-phosphate dehydrogenase [Candidatus Dormibacteraeota bacterium]